MLVRSGCTLPILMIINESTLHARIFHEVTKWVTTSVVSNVQASHLITVIQSLFKVRGTNKRREKSIIISLFKVRGTDKRREKSIIIST